jgi:hypothetical protein
MGLSEALTDKDKKALVISDCAKLIDEEVASKGLMAAPLKLGYQAVKGVKPGFIPHVIEHLLPEFATKIDPIWAEGVATGNAPKFLESNKSRVADALLSVTDAKSQNAKSEIVKKTYSSLRGTAKKHVEEAIPRLSKIIQKYA